MMRLLFLVLLASTSLLALESLTDAQAIISQNVPCEKLDASQLEHVGEYLMEQMHPGQAHELMHKMMGLKEGSEAEIKFHIALAKRLYCNQEPVGYGGMMPMMGYWANRFELTNGGISMPYYGMMDYAWGVGGSVNWILITLLLLGLTIAVFLWIVKLLREIQEKRR